MIITKLQGGLGNQMFQYSIARGIAIEHNTDVLLNNTYFEKKDSRGFGLDSFLFKKQIAGANELFLFGMDGAKSGINTYYRFLKKIITPIVIKEKQFHFDETVLFNAKKYTSLIGYWQTEKYFYKIENELRADFTIKNPLEDENLFFANKIMSCNSVSLHVRRGDYLINPNAVKIHGICDLNYYYKAIEFISKQVSDPVLFIFSDDLKWVRENFSVSIPVYYIDHNNEKAYEDMRLMSLCKHNIIANSTFSWWGAWLNINKTKIVIAPERWFQTNEFNSSDVIPEKWIKL